eukprot:TRINITY_DN4838_c0_g1_i1.p1 TRINITY_DN4838_c0_g1~~TRINITY_DN4838_c0_g1_i1.p1  ORF type:complete len:147 (+),score=19.52 TRINITY_DN4838_c0_g1_i1:57-497(+)
MGIEASRCYSAERLADEISVPDEWDDISNDVGNCLVNAQPFASIASTVKDPPVGIGKSLITAQSFSPRASSKDAASTCDTPEDTLLIDSISTTQSFANEESGFESESQVSFKQSSFKPEREETEMTDPMMPELVDYTSRSSRAITV